jgi:adenylate kinase
VSDDIILGVVGMSSRSRPAARVILDGVVRTTQAEGRRAPLADRAPDRARPLPRRQRPGDPRRIARRRTQESRADDAPEAVARRLRAYREQTAPVLAWYEAHGGVHRVPGTGSIDEIAGRIREALGR